MPKSKGKKPIFEKTFPCPHCKKLNYVKAERIVLVKAEPAEVEIKITVEKAEQVTLDGAD